MLATDAPPPPEPSAVRTMLDRPVAQIAAFVSSCASFWLRALIHPWRAGRDACARPETAPPPFAWLVTMLFVTGVGLRLLFAIAAVPPSDNLSLLGDLRTALGDVSLTGAVLTTLPCVLLVALPAIAISRLLGVCRPPDDNPLLAAACHALGWQLGCVTLFIGAMIALRMAGMEPFGKSGDEIEAGLPYLIATMIIWGALILAPSIFQRTEANLAVGVGACLLITGPLLMTTLFCLGHSVDVQAADKIANARQLREMVGDLHLRVLESEPLESGMGKERHRLKVVYTNLSERLLIVSRQSEFTPQEGVVARRLRVVESSLDFLPDRALLIEPGQTRLAEYTVEPQAGLIGATLGVVGNLAYRAPYHRREPDGDFLQGEAQLYTPREAALPRIGQTPLLRR